MWTSAFALAPVLVVRAFSLDWRSLRMVGVAVAAAWLAEMLAGRLFKKKAALEDGSAFLTGLILAILLPPTLPASAVALGSFVAIFGGREIFGGLGASPFHPALVGWAFLQAAFPSALEGASLAGTLVLPFALGALILIWQKLIFWELPLLHLATLYLFLPLAGKGLGREVFSGPAFFVAFFLITDPVTTPLTRSGARVFAALAAVLIAALSFQNLPYVARGGFAILAANACVPWIDRWIRPRGVLRIP